MGRWLDRLHAKTAAPPLTPTAKTDKRGSEGAFGSFVSDPEGGCRIPREAAPAAADGRRAEIRDRLVRWGWPADLAAATASRIARRHGDDDRRTCPECARYRPGRCLRHRAAGLLAPDVGHDLAALPQRCPGHLEANHHAKP
jgi:hypothetical protein